MPEQRNIFHDVFPFAKFLIGKELSYRAKENSDERSTVYR